MESNPITCRYPQDGWVEQDAVEIWDAQLDSARRLLERMRIAAADIAAIGITNQRETTVVWERRTGRPISPAIVWQCRRTAAFCTELANSAAGPGIAAKTGLVIDAYFSGSKIRWILDHVPDARAQARDGELCFGNIDTWLIWKLTNGAVHATDPTNASRTMLMNLATGDWDDGLLNAFDIPRAMLPRIVRFERRGRNHRGGASGCGHSDRRHRGRSAGGAGGPGLFPPRAYPKTRTAQVVSP